MFSVQAEPLQGTVGILAVVPSGSPVSFVVKVVTGVEEILNSVVVLGSNVVVKPVAHALPEQGTVGTSLTLAT